MKKRWTRFVTIRDDGFGSFAIVNTYCGLWRCDYTVAMTEDAVMHHWYATGFARPWYRVTNDENYTALWNPIQRPNNQPLFQRVKGQAWDSKKSNPGSRGISMSFPRRVAGNGGNHQANKERKTHES